MARDKPRAKADDTSKEDPKPAAPPREPPEGFLRRSLIGSGGQQ